MGKSGQRRVRTVARAISTSTGLRPSAVALAVATCFSGSLAIANPTNPTVVNGTATFNQAGNILNITNSHNAIINWGGFSIGVNELTKFIQPSALSAVLNRVTGQDPSAILGALQSNGRVFIINPNGITFGAGAQIDVAGLVASTLNLSDSDFLAGRMRFTDGANAGNVVNQGNITGGSVYMVGKAVSNEGLITSPNGEVVLAAGNSVELVNPGTPNLRVEIVAPDNEARNLGTIAAEAGRIGIYAGLIKQGGVISADSAVASGGRIMLKSTKSTTLEEGSVTSAKGTSGGEILVFSDMSEGTTHVAGTLDASATVGDGGFIETSAAKVKVADSARVKTLGGASGQSGKWLIDPNDFYIAYGGDIDGTTLSSNLEGGNIEIQSAYGSSAGTGTIFVNDNVFWSSNSNLTLTAVGDIKFGVSSGNALDGANGSVTLNAGGAIYTDAYGSSVFDVRANTLTANAVNGIGSQAYALRTQVANANLNNSYGGDIVIANSGGINLVANNNSAYGGIIDVTADHIDIVGNSSARGDVFLWAPTSASILVSGGAALESLAGNINLRSQDIDVSGASVVRGNNIFIDNDMGDLFVYTVGGEGSINSASFAKMQLHDPASGEVLLKSRGAVYLNAPITLDPAKAETLRIVSGISGSNGLNIEQAPGAPVSVKKLRLEAGIGDVSEAGSVLMGDANNMVDVLSGEAGGTFDFRNAKALTIGTVGSGFGNTPGVRADSDGFTSLELHVNGMLTVNDNVVASGYDSAETILQATGNILLNANVRAESSSGSYPNTVSIASSGGMISQTSPSALIYSGSGYYYGNDVIELTAASGIGTQAAPVRIDNSTNDPDIRAQNTGMTGDIALSFNGGPVYIDGGVNALVGTFNNNPSGTYFVQAETSGINMWGSFLPGAVNPAPLLPNQKVVLKAPVGTIMIDGSEGASIIVPSGGSGGVTLEASTITVYPRFDDEPAIAGQNVKLKADNIYLWTPEVSAPSIVGGDVVIQTLTGGRGIDIGGTNTAYGGTAILANSELNQISAPHIQIGDTAGGPLTIVGDLSHTGLLDLRGSTISQSGGNLSTLFDAQAATTINLSQTGSYTLGLLQAGTSISVNSSGGSILDGNASANIVAPTAMLTAFNGSIGSLANPLETVVANLSLDAYGGEIGVINSGNLSLDQLYFSGTNAVVGSTGILTVNTSVDITGNLALFGNTGLTADEVGIFADGISLGAGAGNLTLTNSTVSANTTLGLTGNNVILSNTEAGSYGGITVNATGNLSVLDNSWLGGSGITNILTGGNVLVDQSTIFGNPDVIMTVGGTVNINGIMGSPGIIEAGSVETIKLTFPLLAEGGFFINGIEGVVFDSATGSGFFADGSPAILGSNLLVTYGAGSSIQPPTDTLIVALAKATEPPPASNVEGGETEEEKKEKENTPVCR